MALPTQVTVNNFNTPNKSGHFYPNDGVIDQLLRKIEFIAIPRVASVTNAQLSQRENRYSAQLFKFTKSKKQKFTRF